MLCDGSRQMLKRQKCPWIKYVGAAGTRCWENGEDNKDLDGSSLKQHVKVGM